MMPGCLLRTDDSQLDRWDGMTATSQPARPATSEQSGLAAPGTGKLDYLGWTVSSIEIEERHARSERRLHRVIVATSAAWYIVLHGATPIRINKI
ncbi:BZ3500_MvSof-1268-A1-R1_Chr6-2g08519 [Microbotryum saponariae]|uniref:BZ3500_MvSof-1268-A1-R1_Chr6-2g08519 protein n=1 Tax=Microbotryum saponariae TaxID=289078 RepID=A0A2X0KHW6_9BASI|nr:BZ3500_MvSof-1268-A1-R1_Chr6-2g08519 [Microbotryum saponariae]SDA07796.1 BZ3501_MvSof-1269-A2-R1_Chr6-1g08233 [Microbotryum saponariae]